MRKVCSGTEHFTSERRRFDAFAFAYAAAASLWDKELPEKNSFTLAHADPQEFFKQQQMKNTYQQM